MIGIFVSCASWHR